ncbi:MAG: carbonic anhydrase [Thermoanaerobaculia bacterium]
MRLKLVALSLVLCLFANAQEKTAPVQPNQAPTPEMFWQALLTGNKQFVAGKLTYDNLAQERRQLADNQFPPMTILSCSDSRVPPELVFNQSLGSLFIVRSAGNVTDELGLASIEYAIAQNWTMLIVVLAHEDCGAIKASMGQADPVSPNLLALVTRIRGSFYGINWDPKNDVDVRKATIANAKLSAASLLAQSVIVRQAVAAGTVKIVVAYYSTATGVVERVE